jgi:alkyl hydroperoxide reductase subunit D
MSLQETRNDLLNDLGIAEDSIMDLLDTLVKGESRYIRDLRINLKSVLDSESLESKEAYLLALAVAVNERNEVLIKGFAESAVNEGASDAEIAETHACASLLATNNVFYRFKHFIRGSNDNYQDMPARIKMNIMARPVLGKEFFELMSLVVSAVNGCEACLKAHESSVRNLGSSEARIFDAVRLAAVVRGLSLVLR